MSVTMFRVVLFLTCLLTASCGYLDEDLLVDDATFGESFGVGGIGMSGVGHSYGCGGAGYRHRAHSSVGLHHSIMMMDGMSFQVSLSDEEILEQTDVEMVDVTQPVRTAPVAANIPERAFIEATEARNASITAHMAGR